MKAAVVVFPGSNGDRDLLECGGHDLNFEGPVPVEDPAAFDRTHIILIEHDDHASSCVNASVVISVRQRMCGNSIRRPISAYRG